MSPKNRRVDSRTREDRRWDDLRKVLRECLNSNQNIFPESVIRRSAYLALQDDMRRIYRRHKTRSR